MYTALISPDTNGWQIEVWENESQIGFTDAPDYESVDGRTLQFLNSEGFDPEDIEYQFV